MKLLIGILLFILNSIFLLAENYKYSDNDNSKLSDLINKVNPYDTILISKKLIHEANITITKPLTIIGINNPIIDAQSKGGSILIVKSNNVYLYGLRIKNVQRANIYDNAAIKLLDSRYCVVENCMIENAFFGIYLARTKDCHIYNNKIIGNSKHESSSGNGIHLWQCRNISIMNNKIFNQRDGIYFEFVKHAYIENNYSEKNLRYGLHFMFSDSCQYKNNIFQKNGAGVAVMYTHSVYMENNIFNDNWGPSAYGLLLKEIKNSKIIGNKFLNNTVGIYAEGSSKIIAEKNKFERNGWALKIMANCENNKFTYNNFLSNTFDISTNSQSNFNTFNRNYWSSYSGYDLNKDGVGDVPFHPVRLFSLLIAQQQSAMILLHSFFIEALDLAERIFPFLTPATLVDNQPFMKVIK